MGLLKEIITFNGILFSSTKNEGILYMMIWKKSLMELLSKTIIRKVRCKAMCRVH